MTRVFCDGAARRPGPTSLSVNSPAPGTCAPTRRSGRPGDRRRLAADSSRWIAMGVRRIMSAGALRAGPSAGRAGLLDPPPGPEVVWQVQLVDDLPRLLPGPSRPR